MTDYLIPMILLLASALSLGKKENSYSLLLEGGAEGLRLLKDILPTLVLLLTAVELFRNLISLVLVVSANGSRVIYAQP